MNELNSDEIEIAIKEREKEIQLLKEDLKRLKGPLKDRIVNTLKDKKDAAINVGKTIKRKVRENFDAKELNKELMDKQKSLNEELEKLKKKVAELQ